MMKVVRALRGLAPRSELRRHVVVLAGATSIAQIIVVVSAPVITRLYTPSEVGVFSVANAILSILIVVSCLRYEMAIPLPDDDVAAANVLALSLITTLGLSLAAGAALWFLGPSLLAFFGASTLGPYVLLLTLGQLGGGAVSALTLWAIRTKSFSTIAATRLTQTGTLVATQVGLGFVGFGAPGLLLGSVAGTVAGSGRLARSAWRTNAPAFRQVSRTEIVAVASRYRRFPLLAAPAALLNTMGLQAPLLLIVALFGTSVGGHYALADRICGLPVTLVAGAVAQVFFGETARLARVEPTALRGLFWRTTRSVGRNAIGPFLLLTVAAPLLAGPLLGEQWGQTGVFVAILAPMYFMQLVATSTGSLLDVLERQDLSLFRELLRLCFVGGAVLLAAASGLQAIGAVCALSAAGCLTYALYAAITWRAVVDREPRPTNLPPKPMAYASEESSLPVTVVPTSDDRRVLLIETPHSYVQERRYVFDVVLCEWLGLDYQLQFSDAPRVAIRLDGDPEAREIRLPDRLFGTTPEDWLTPRSLPHPPLSWHSAPVAEGADPRDQHESLGNVRTNVSIPFLFGREGAGSGVWQRTNGRIEFDVDVFGTVFFMLTRYEEVARPSFDRHGRFPASASLAAKAGFLDRPIVDDYVDVLWAAISCLWPELRRPMSEFRLRLTHDVDTPRAAHQDVGHIVQALASDLFLRRDPAFATRRLRSSLNSRAGRIDRDPYDTFDFLMDVSERHGLKSTFYFLAGGGVPQDGGYALSDPRLVALLGQIHQRGHHVGLHASYRSFRSSEEIRREFKTLRSACDAAGFDQPVWGVRQHFLRFANPWTWRAQEAAGLDHDSTLGFADRIGFRAGTCREFPVFDLLARQMMKLRERPLLVMDGTLFEYMSLDMSDAAAQVRVIVGPCRLHGGDAVLLYHNQTVASARGATHYRDLVEEIARRADLSR
jgi:O-antigen/teichoic acid export membrane protein